MRCKGGILRFSLRHLQAGAVCLLAAVLLGTAAVRGAARSAAADARAQGVALPILMYHSILKDPARTGTYVVTPEDFRRDMVWLRDHGYTTVHLAEVLDYVYEGAPLPEKPVVVTFDDGYVNNYLYAYPILQEMGMKAVLSPIGKYTDLYTGSGDDSPYYAHCTWGQLQEMAASGVMEIQNHTYDLHTYSAARHGCAGNKGEAPAQYRQIVGEDIMQAQNAIRAQLGVSPEMLVYPFGSYNAASEELIRSLGFRGSLSCETGIAVVTDEESLYRMKRLLRPGGVSTGEFFAGAGL